MSSDGERGRGARVVGAGELDEPADAVDELHRSQARAVGVEQPRAVDEDGEALRARDRDVEAVGVEEEVEAARDVLAGRAGHRVEDDRRLLALEAVDGADADAGGDAVADAAHGEVVGRDDEDVVGDEVAGSSPSSSVTVAPASRSRHAAAIAVGLLGAGLAAALVLDRERAQPDAGDARRRARRPGASAHAGRERRRES